MCACDYQPGVQPDLKTLSTVFSDLGIDWEAFITKQEGDVQRLAQAAKDTHVDAVVAYGGDGTVAGVVNGLRGSTIPLVFFPGGTANLIS